MYCAVGVVASVGQVSASKLVLPVDGLLLWWLRSGCRRSLSSSGTPPEAAVTLESAGKASYIGYSVDIGLLFRSGTNFWRDQGAYV